ncbi:MAG: hydrogenase iron-sulfur subunit, partial [Desulfovibrio sp.]|nr:hydrogenase iron-sulfur subunit [Desulfovibrio sp.]
MSVLDGKELRIVGFLCNWCSYGGADTAGVARATQPTDLRIIRVPCSGRVDPLFVIKALLGGADGVLVSGCHPRDCHYAAGNFYARRRLEVLKQFLPVLGIDDRRFEYTWVSASEGQRWQQVVTLFTERIHKLGPAPQLEDAEPLLRVADMALTALRPLGTGQKAALDELKAAV